jgi:hypothetical protein
VAFIPGNSELKPYRGYSRGAGGCLLLAQSRREVVRCANVRFLGKSRHDVLRESAFASLLGVKRTLLFATHMSAYVPNAQRRRDWPPHRVARYSAGHLAADASCLQAPSPSIPPARAHTLRSAPRCPLRLQRRRCEESLRIEDRRSRTRLPSNNNRLFRAGSKSKSYCEYGNIAS